MLKIYKKPEELQNAINLTRLNFPDLITIHHTLETELYKRFQDTEVTAFCHENSSGEELWIVVRINRYML